MIRSYEETGEWFGRIEEVVEDIRDQGYEVEESNREYITFSDDEDNEFIAYLGGTERTIYIDRVEEI